VPAEQVADGLLEYMVSVYEGGKARTFPGGVPGHPFQWDFTGRESWQVPVVAAGAPILLFDAWRDRDHLLVPHPWSYVRFRTDVAAGSGPERLALSAVVEDFAPAPHHFALRTFLPETQRTRLADADSAGVLRVRARAVGRAADRVEVSLVERDGTAWGAVIDLADAWRDIVVPLADLRPTALALLPRPYPQFLPYLFEGPTDGAGPRLADLDGLQFSTSAGLFGDSDAAGPHGFAVEHVVLETGR
jgi:hypothetical protein